MLSALQHSITPSLRGRQFSTRGRMSEPAHTGLASSVSGMAKRRRTILPLPATKEWGVGRPVNTAQKRPQPVQGTPVHEPSGNQPTPDPSQEGNWPAGVAPLLGGAGGTAIELGWRCNALCDPLHHNPNRNPNLPMDFGSKSKSKSTIKNFAKCLNSMAVGAGGGYRGAMRAKYSGRFPDPLPAAQGEGIRGAV